jgi:hypothetical protein
VRQSRLLLRVFGPEEAGGTTQRDRVSPSRRRPDDLARDPVSSPAATDLLALSGVPDRIDFGLDPDSLVAGDLSQRGPDIVRAVEAAAVTDAVRTLAASHGLDPVRLVIALLALATRRNRRSGLRVARAILGGPASAEVLELAGLCGLEPEPRSGWLRG